MRLTDIQRDVVARNLAGRIGSKPYPYLCALFGDDARVRIRYQETPYAFAVETLRVCEERWRQGDKGWCQSLWACEVSTIEDVQSVFKAHREALEEEDRLRQSAAAADPFADMRVCRGSAFLDRQGLRRELK